MRAAIFVLLLVASTARAEPLSAVRLCFEGLDPTTPLFVDRVAPHYRAVGAAGFMLDLDLTIQGRNPARITRGGGACLRAWIPAGSVSRIEARFERTATNFLPAKLPVKLTLIADRWSEGGTLNLTRGAYGAVETDLPGSVQVARVEHEGDAPMAEPTRLPVGRYRVRYLPLPPPQGPCTIDLQVEASGTVRLDNHPDEVAARAEHFRTAVLPVVLQRLHETCSADQSLQVRLELWDGIYLHPENPERKKKSAVNGPQPHYALRGAGGVHPYVLGEPVDLRYGQNLHLVASPEADAVADRTP